ncbi:oligosaccharide flippase family protein [Tenacibaculum sp. UWU-22]|uniref:oligosaccharide flippase family protein n=1 Tax=Tenacibaculum sp. UWU-22 TaxID=3234187 RepID=UPI0034DB7083
MKLEFSWVFVSNLIKAFYQWSFVILLTKFFSAQEVGLYTLTLAILSPIFMLTNMQTRSVLVVDMDDNEGVFLNYLHMRLITVFLSIIGVFIFFFNKEFVGLLMGVALLKGVEAIMDIFYGFFQRNNQMKTMSKSIIIKSVLSLVALLICLSLFKSLLLALGVIIALNIAVFFVYDYKYIREKVKLHIRHLKIDKIKNIFLNSIFLGISVFIMSLITNYPRLKINEILGTKMLGVFGVYAFFMTGLSQVISPVEIILRPKFRDAFRERSLKLYKTYILKAFLFILIIGLFTCFLFYFFGDFLISVLYSKEYSKYLSVIFYLVVAQVFMSFSGLCNIMLQSMQKFKFQALVSSFMLLLVFLSSDFLILKYNLIGAGYLILLYSVINFLLYLSIFLVNVSSIKK